MESLLARFIGPAIEKLYWLGVRDGAMMAAVTLLLLWTLFQRRDTP